METMRQHMAGLVVFRDLLKDPVVEKFGQILTNGTHADTAITALADFTATLFATTTNWTTYLLNLVLESENICICKAAHGGAGEILTACLHQELETLGQMAQLDFKTYLTKIPVEVGEKIKFLPQWQVENLDFVQLYTQRMGQVSQKGYGMFAKYHVFTVEQGQLQPVRHPDPQTLEELPGYEMERNKIITNTKALITGQPANNVLLYGDAGTGKSSSVKAIANAFVEDGLRLIEVKKNQLYQLPAIMERLATNPLKFILFIDDLSFAANDDNFAALKAILEGSVCGLADNVVVYATSNRRHLVKELLSDRTGDDIHASDTRQELMSLSARFGLVVTFQQPEKAKYEAIILALAQQYGVEVPDPARLITRAEAFALRAGGRSPRVAKQFIQLCKVGVQ